MGRGHRDRGRHRLAHGQRIRSVRGGPAPEDRLALTYTESYGAGAPVTVFGHGVASSIEDVRFLGSGVPGTKVFVGSPPERWNYPDAAADLRAVADETGAAGCLGVSMSAGALCRILSETPDRFEYAVFVLPASLDRPRSSPGLLAHADVVERATVDELAEHLFAELPDELKPLRGMRPLMRDRAERQSRPGVAEALRAIAGTLPIADRAALRGVTARCLVIAQHGDDVHPVDVAYDLAEVLPDATLHVFDRPWSMLREREKLRRLIAGFVSDSNWGNGSSP